MTAILMIAYVPLSSSGRHILLRHFNLLVKSVRKPLFSEEKIIFSFFWENRKKKLINSVLFFRFFEPESI